MKGLLKTMLILSLAMNSVAMATELESLADDALGATTGQDGITVKIRNTTGQISIDRLMLHDNDGLNLDVVNPVVGNTQWITDKTTLGTAGALVIDNVSIAQRDKSKFLATLLIDTEGGLGVDATDPFLNINVILGDIDIRVGDITVAASNDKSTMVGANRDIKEWTQTAPLISGYGGVDNQLAASVGSASLNIQLGNAPQGGMIRAIGNISNGLTLSNLAINDLEGGGSIGIDNIMIADTGASGLSIDAMIRMTNKGIEISNKDSLLGAHIYLRQVRIGDLAGMAGGASATTKAIGDIELQGVRIADAVLFVKGH